MNTTTTENFDAALTNFVALHSADHRPTTRTTVIASGSESECRRAAAKKLGVSSLRGLAQSPTERGVRYYGRGSTDDDGESVEIR